MQLGQELDCIDFDTAAEVSGSKFVYLKRAAALLELALVNYAMQKVVSKGFVPMMTPDLVRESVLEKCGFQPRGIETQVEAPEPNTKVSLKTSPDGGNLCSVRRHCGQSVLISAHPPIQLSSLFRPQHPDHSQLSTRVK